MHSHVGMQNQVLMNAPLVLEDEMAQREDRQEIVLMLQYVPDTRAKSSDCTASFAWSPRHQVLSVGAVAGRPRCSSRACA
jgi:hypothetical protein